MLKNEKVYFPNLNGLRFIAALLVIIHHVEQLKFKFHIESYWLSVPFVRHCGKLGVEMFFVLSGFLITYLLMTEEKSLGTISVRKFYIRRMLRIWPLYFLIIFLAFAVLPNLGNLFILPGYGREVIYADLPLKLLLYALFLPNLVLSLLGTVPFASQTWSIGTEEQFYLVWPFLLRIIKKHRLWLMLFIIGFYAAFAFFLSGKYAAFLPFSKVIQAFWNSFTIDSMAMGGIFAILLFSRSRYLSIVLNNVVFYSVLILIAVLMIKAVKMPHLFYSFLFGIMILNFAANRNAGISLENRPMNYLGNISYGLYMFHPISITLAILVAKATGVSGNWLLYLMSLLFTVLLAGVSYRYYELYFLRYKKHFERVISGNATHTD